MSDKLSFLDGGEPPADPVVTPAPADPAIVPEPAPPPETPPQAAPTPEPSAPVTPPPGFVPVAAVQDIRSKWQAEANARAAAEHRLRALEAQAQQRAEAPDMFSDPDGFREHLRVELETQRWTDKVEMSEIVARQQYGAQTVEQAKSEFLAQCPPGSPEALAMRQSTHPVEHVVQWHKRQQMLKTIGDVPDLDDFVKRRAAELGLIPGQAGAQQQPLTAQPTQQPRIGPVTIASAPSAAGVTPPGPSGPGTAFEAVFTR